MKKGLGKKPLILVLILVGVLLIGGVVFFFLSRNNGADQGDSAVIADDSGSSVPPAESQKPKRKVYPIGKWDLPIPYLNPFGSQANYKAVEYKNNQYEGFEYVNKDNMLTSRITAGEVWDMEVEWTDENTDSFDDLNLYISELGGETYQGDGEDRRVIHIKDKDNVEWWGLASKYGSTSYSLRVYKETALEVGKPLAIKTSDYKDPNIYFITKHGGTKFESMTVNMTDGEFRLSGDSEYSIGEYDKEIGYEKQLSAIKTKDYVLDDIPQDSSAPILWKVNYDKDSDPKELTFGLETGADISPVRYGERLGALKVHGAKFGSVEVKPAFGANINHPDLLRSTFSGDVTPEGDTIFWVPSGYWNVEISPNKNEYVNYCRARLIPVSEGEMTVLDIPPAINDSYGNSEQGVAGGNESGIKIMEAKEQGAQATMTFELLDSQNPKMTPTAQNTQVTEGGKDAKIVQIERLKTPPSVVLVLDSSGSMKGQMEQTVTAAKTFIQGLPDDAFIQVIDFDTKPTVLKGTTKAEVLKGLASVKANGATCLYDSIIKGLELLNGKERPTLVVFTDGVDANANDTGPGSVATKQDAMEAVKAANITLFTIGFGPKHDGTTLLELAGVSDGMYYPAQDKAALDKVFEAINNKLGNTFKLTYERPKEAAPADVPVISLVLDTSGSMDKDPSNENCDYRIDKVKRVYHGFINRIPDQSLVQLMRFSDDVTIEQVNTVRKPELLQALGELYSNGGTEILMSVTSAYKAIKPVASNKRIIVYMTDAALSVEDSQKPAFELLLQEIKEQGIQILWVGLGIQGSEDAFKWAAEKSGGSYVISEDAQVIGKALDDALAKVQKLPADKLTVSLNIKNDTGKGSQDTYSATQLVDFPIPQTSGEKITLNTLSYQTGIKMNQYEPKTSQLVYGTSIPNKEVKLSKKIALNVSGKNKAMEWTAVEAYYLSMLRGVDPPNGMCYMAVEMEMKNILSDRPYLIPDISSHFFINVNNKGSYPASTATWLTETPLTPPGDSSLYIGTGETVHGLLVFLVPDEKTEQASLHFYDTSYGHITLAAIGEPKKEEVALEALPTTANGKLSDTFDITIKSKKDIQKIEDIELKENTTYRVIEGELNTKVQALLNINPSERFYLKMQTGSGPFMVKMNESTALIPYGFLRPVMLAPGSANNVRLAFQIPTAIKDAKMELYGDIKGGPISLPVSGTAPYGAQTTGTPYQGDGMSLVVNSLSRAQKVDDHGGYFVVADITVSDIGDGYGTYGFDNAFTLVREGYDPSQDQGAKADRKGLGSFGSQSSNENVLVPDEMTQRIVFGIDGKWAVFDGEQRRGQIIFRLPDESSEGWTLQSPFFSTLKLPVSQEEYKDSALLVDAVSPDVDQGFNERLAEELKKVIKEYESYKAANPPSVNVPKMGIDASPQKNIVPAPMTTVQGAVRLKEIKTMDDFKAVMDELKWIPSNEDYWHYRYSPEAVLTQGWGSQGDLANLAGHLLSKMGYSPKPKLVKITDKGRMTLKLLGMLDKVEVESVTGWAYTDEQGNSHVFVVPFMKDLSELGQLAYIPSSEKRDMVANECDINVSFKVVAKDNGNVAGDAASALGGGGEAEPAVEDAGILSTRLTLDKLSLDSVDIRMAGTSLGYTAILDTGSSEIMGDSYVDPKLYNVVGVVIKVRTPSGSYVHETRLEDGDDISGVFHTLALNLPDLPKESADTLQKAADNAYKNALKPDEMSTLRWYTRGIINKFLAVQTEYEKSLQKGLKVLAGRTDTERCIVVTVKRKDAQAPLVTSVDLVNSANQVHQGSEDAVRSFNLMSGLHASVLEGAALPGDNYSFMDIWAKCPSDTKIFMSMVENRRDDVEYMKEQGYPEFMVNRVEKSDKVMIMTNKPAVINGKSRWAWLEIDPKTYETIAVLDTGEKGGSAEYVIQNFSPNGDDYKEFMVGAFIGIDVSVWSVASFTLELSDPKQILEAAKAATYQICETLDGFMNNVGYAKLEVGIGPVKGKLGSEEYDYLAKYFEEAKGGNFKGEPGQNVINFKLGFDSAAAWYFKQMEKSMASPGK